MRVTSVLISLGLVAAVAVVSGCSGKRKDAFAFHGVVFKAKTRPVDKKVSRADFTATIFDATQSLDGAREAARYEGTKYCIANYGTSMIDWSVGPESEPGRLSVSDNAITFRGRCDP
ncbi:hypothetical protein [Sedimentitalea nanhaiensis]|uniref:Lipoprotein n=1 Tax=Sedimentitalea nanhaiensis TaxID=999627 RepID=A0A1I6ZLY5_9RHOB|nr:hypothetical protein [Sedimentitalea nanhaiensis]SFT63622.1 hypothetical protein SAMN05216236_104190 [Sedimentitalea nanhaiensis]